MIKLKAPVGDTSRKDPAVKNLPEDVALVRLMLRENGFMVAPEGKADPGLLKAIAAAQKKAGIKYPDKIVDPGGRTFKFLLPKYDKGAKAAAKIEMVAITLDGKKLLVPKASFDALTGPVLDALRAYARMLVAVHAGYQAQIKALIEAAKVRDGYFEAVAEFIKSTVAPVKPYDSKYQTAAEKELAALNKAIAAKDYLAASKAIVAYEKAAALFIAELLRFHFETTGNKATVKKMANFAKTTGIGILRALGGAVPIKGLDLAEIAAAKAAEDAKIVKAKVIEVAKQASAQEVEAIEALTKTAFDAAFSVVSTVGSILLPAKMLDSIAARVAKTVQNAIKMTAAQALRLVKAVLTGPAAQMLAKIVHGVIQTLRPVLGGNAPTQKQIEDAVVKLVEAFIKTDLVARLQGFLKKLQGVLNGILDKLIEGIVKRLVKTGKLAATVLAKVIAAARKAVLSLAEDVGRELVLTQMKGDEAIDKLVGMARKAVESNAQLLRKIEAEVRKALKASQITV